MSLLAKFDALNQTDLSALSARLAALRAEMERDLEIKTRATPAQTPAPITASGNMVSSLTVEQLIYELAQAQRSAS